MPVRVKAKKRTSICLLVTTDLTIWPMVGLFLTGPAFLPSVGGSKGAAFLTKIMFMITKLVENTAATTK